MSDIYEGSFLTICANWSPDSGGGLFSDRYTGRRDTDSPERAAPFRVHDDPPIDARLVFTPHFWGNSLKDAQELGVVPDPAADPLLTRAWCLQERLLSVRIVEFTLEEIRWECKTERRCECQEDDKRAAPTRRMQVSRLSLAFDTNMGQAWPDLVSSYTAMAITYPRDRLPALSGLAHHFYGVKGDLHTASGYLAGIWKEDLLASLVWYIQPHMFIGPDDKPKPRHLPLQEYRAPSWSWASREGQAIFTNFKADKELEIIESSCKYEADICGRCVGGSMKVCGRLAPVTLKYGTGGYKGEETAFMQSWEKTYWVEKDDLSTYIKADTEIGVKGHADYLPSNSAVFCLRVGWETLERYPKPKASCGLVLRRLPGTDQYVRIAKFTKHDVENKLVFMKRRKEDGSGMEDIVQYDDFFDGVGRTTIEII